jgi:hypothetical protein
MKIELQNISATDDGLYEYESNKILVFVPKDEINKLSFGFVSPIRWPAFAVAIGVFLICIGIVFGAYPLINSIIDHVNNFPRLKGYAFISLHILFGIYFTRLGLRKKDCLILDTNKGIKKLAINGQVAEQKVTDFLNEAAQQLKYPI